MTRIRAARAPPRPHTIEPPDPIDRHLGPLERSPPRTPKDASNRSDRLVTPLRSRPPTPPRKGVKFDLKKQVIFQAFTNSRPRKFRTFARIFIRDAHRPRQRAITSRKDDRQEEQKRVRIKMHNVRRGSGRESSIDGPIGSSVALA